jgi:hypothetical protein
LNLRVRTVDLALPLVVVTALAVAADPPRLVDTQPAEVPVTGTISDPCSGEELTFTGIARVNVWSERNGAGSFDVRLNADFSGAQSESENGTSQALSGIVNGTGRVSPPFPSTLSIEGYGLILEEGSAEELAARVRFQVTATEQGSVAPTGSAEVLALECRR